jgi:hypothetical protein
VASKWKYVFYNGVVYRGVGIDADGALINPNAYPEDVARAAVREAEARQREERSQTAKKAAQTRRRRLERLVYATSCAIVEGRCFAPKTNATSATRPYPMPNRSSEASARTAGRGCWRRSSG